MQRNKTFNQKAKSRFGNHTDSSEESDRDNDGSDDSSDDGDGNSDKNDAESEYKKKGLAVFSEYFQAANTELLLVCTSTHVLFLENQKRDKVLLKVKIEDVLYAMGKKSILKLGLILKKKINTNNETHDCKLEFTVGSGGARAIGEDILTYCQIYLLEYTTNNSDHCEMIKRNVFDGLYDGKEGKYGERDGKKQMGLDLIITDDILLGKINLSSTQTKIKTRSQLGRDQNAED